MSGAANAASGGSVVGHPRVLIVGGGSIGERHLRCFGAIGARVALCEIDQARRAALAEQYRPVESHGSLANALQARWDAVVIATPAHLHARHAIEAAASAKAILIEKPLATSLLDLAELDRATIGHIVGVAYVYRCHPAVQAARRRLIAGEIGTLLQITATSGQHFPTYRPAYRDIYYADRATGGGAVQDAATHLFNLVHYLSGPFAWVYGDYGHQALAGVTVEDTVHVVGRTAGGKVMVSISLNQFMAPNESIVQLNGAAGSLQIRLDEGRCGLYRHGASEWEWSERLLCARDELFRLQARQFLSAAVMAEPLPCDLVEATHTLKVNLAVLASNAKRVVPIE